MKAFVVAGRYSARESMPPSGKVLRPSQSSGVGRPAAMNPGETSEPVPTNRKRRGLLIVAIAITLAAAVLLVVLFGGFLGGQPAGPTPSVTLASPTRFGVILYFTVASADPRAPLTDFRAVYEVENDTAAELAPLAHNATYGSLGFRDNDGDGRLSEGDEFTVIIRDAGYHELRIVHRQTPVATDSWTEVPIVALGSLVIGPSGATVEVQWINPSATPLVDFRATLSLDGTVVGDIDPLADDASDGNLTFSEQYPDARLDEGDRFISDSPATGDYELAILWRGVLAGQMSWTI